MLCVWCRQLQPSICSIQYHDTVTTNSTRGGCEWASDSLLALHATSDSVENREAMTIIMKVSNFALSVRMISIPSPNHIHACMQVENYVHTTAWGI